MEMSTCIKSVVVAANQYRNNSSEVHLTHLQRQLDVLIGLTQKGNKLTHFNPRELAATECITFMVEILDDLPVKPTLAQKCMLLLTNIAADDATRVALHHTYHLTTCLVKYLTRSTSLGFDTSDPAILQCLKLLQTITYNCRISFQEPYVEDLVNYTVTTILSPESELSQLCLGVLANLCRKNFTIQSLVKNLYNMKDLYRTLIKGMNHSDQRTVIFCLTIIVSLCLHGDFEDLFFRPQNTYGTFKLIFNVLVGNDSSTTRRHAVDLFTDILLQPRLQKALIKYEHLDQCIKQILNLIPKLHGESAIKIFELLLSFCSVNGLRCVVCRNLFESPTLQDSSRYKELLNANNPHLAEPLFAVVHWASQSVDTHGNAPILALEFLKEVYQEVIDLNLLDQMSPRTDHVFPMVTEILMSPVKMDSPTARKHCLRLVRALQLLIALSGDPTIEPAVAKSLDAKTCIAIVEHQLNHNRIAFSHTFNTSDPDDSSEVGVEVVAYCLDLMVRVQSLVPTLEPSFKELLQEPRLVPFLANAITSDKRELVHVTLKLITHGAPLPNFPTLILGESIAALNAQTTKRVEYKEMNHDDGAEPAHKRFAWDKEESRVPLNRTDTITSTIKRTESMEDKKLETSIDSLIDKMNTGMELKDARASEIIRVYEHKVQSLQNKENQLQDLLEAKALALAQADRLIAQYRCRRAQSDAEAQKIRSLLMESERNAEEYHVQVNDLRLQNQRLTTDLEHLFLENKRLEAVSTDYDELAEDHQELVEKFQTLERAHEKVNESFETLGETHELLKRQHNTLLSKHKEASAQLTKLEEEKKILSRSNKENQQQVVDLTKKLNKTDGKLKNTLEERDGLEKSIDKLRLDMDKADKSLKQNLHQVTTLEMVCHQHEEAIAEKDRLLRAQKSELDKHAHIATLIHNLSSGAVPIPKP